MTWTSRLGIAATVAFSALMLWALANLFLNPRHAPTTYSLWVVALVAVGVAVLLPLVYRACRLLELWLLRRSRLVRVLLLVATLAAALGSQLFLGWTTLRQPGFDAALVFSAAGSLATGGELNPAWVDYFAMYPNNLPLTLVLVRYFEGLGLLGVTQLPALLWASVIANAVVLMLGILLTFLVARRVAGLRAGLFSLVFSAAFIVVSPWIGTVYSDTLGIVFPILIVYLFLVSRDARRTGARLAWWALIGVVAAVGYNLKPTVIFALIAVALVAVLEPSVKRVGWRALALPAIAVVLAAGVFAAGHVGIGKAVGASAIVPFDLDDNDRAFPATHFLKMGAQGKGHFLAEDAVATASIPDPEERWRAGLEVYAERVAAMGPAGYAQFLSDKAVAALSDGTFFQWGEGGMTGGFFTTDFVSLAVQSVYALDAMRHEPLVVFWQSFWVVLLTLLAAPLLLRGTPLYGVPATTLRIALIGLVVFLMLFESRSRYIYLYLPFFIVLASVSMEAVSRRVRVVIRKRRMFRPAALVP